MIGKGKYDELCTLVREQSKAPAVFLIVIDDDNSVHYHAQMPPAIYKMLAKDVLRRLADEIEKEAVR